MPLAIQPITPAVAALAADLGVSLQPGATVNAQVLRVLDANLVRIAIGALTLDATTMQPLQQGQRLQLLVGQSEEAVTLTPVARGSDGQVNSSANTLVALDDIPLAPRLPPAVAERPAQTLSPEETRAVALAAQTAVPKQAGLSQLFADLTVALDGRGLPRPVAAVARQLLGLRQTTDSMSASDIRAGLESSGLLLEAATARNAADVPADLKSTLLVLKQALSTWLAEEQRAQPAPAATGAHAAPDGQARTPGAPDGDIPTKAQAAVAAELSDAFAAPGKAVSAPMASAKNLLAMQVLASAADPAAAPADHTAQGRLPPPFRDGAPTPQPVAPPSLRTEAPPAEKARQLLSETDGALARQTLLQVASLPDRIDQQTLRSDPAQPRWHFEIPFATPQGTAMAQFEIERDGAGAAHEAAKRVWRARFSLDIEPAGPVHALITYGAEATHVKMWAERPATAAQIRAQAARLNATLNEADLHAGEIVVADGAPLQTRVPAAGQFLNRAT